MWWYALFEVNCTCMCVATSSSLAVPMPYHTWFRSVHPSKALVLICTFHTETYTTQLPLYWPSILPSATNGAQQKSNTTLNPPQAPSNTLNPHTRKPAYLTNAILVQTHCQEYGMLTHRYGNQVSKPQTSWLVAVIVARKTYNAAN